MESYGDLSGPAGFQDLNGDAGDRSDLHFAQQSSVAAMGDAQNTAYYGINGQPPMVCDIKPRLTKSQHELLEAEYMRQNKPSTSTKKGFAEKLGVSLDKVNNWFQNRRAKSKQDAKKAAGAYNLFHAQQQANQLNFSDSDASPAYPTPDYFSMMQQCSSDEQLPNGNGMGLQEAQHYPEHREYNGLQYSSAANIMEHPGHFGMPPQISQDMFDSPQELNRRTLTQEQFDAFAQHAGSSMDIPGNYGLFHNDFSGNQDILNQVFPELQNGMPKEQHAYAYASVVPPPMSSHDSTLPSSVSDQSISTFPSNSSIRDTGTMSSASSDWADSRSSSVSDVYQEDPYMRSHAAPASTSQWKPGQSVPVDVTALNEEFRQVAQQARHSSPQHFHAHEQPLAWPADDAYQRRHSQTSSMLAQSMSNVGIHTPQPQQHAAFKSPAPPSNIAARRQRPRPAALGIASMRSQSYSGAAQPGSPGQQVPQCLSPGQAQVRRIRSSNVLGGVAQGRIHKPITGAPQRSPLAWSFSDAMNSPKGMRHMSSQTATTLAPPTPLSPELLPQQDHIRSQPGWQGSAHVTRQPSISETDLEHTLSYVPATTAPPQTFSSPPHTPRYRQQGFIQQRIGNHVITENTPPQSAPASQQCFPSNALAHQYLQAHPHQVSPAPHQHQTYMQAPQPHYMNVGVPEQHFDVPVMTALQHQQQQQQMMPVSNAAGGLPMHYSQGIPMVNAQGQLELMMPPQFMQQPQTRHITPPMQPVQQIPTPPKSDQFESMVGMFSTAAPAPAPLQITAQVPKQPPQQPTELFVHEYSPPAEMKRAATPRKAVDTGPKNYSFANHGPDDFARGRKGRAANATATPLSNSPASS